MTATVTQPKITAEERRRREKAVNTARASVRLEGFILDHIVEGIYARYVAGEIEMPQVIAEVKQHAAVNG